MNVISVGIQSYGPNAFNKERIQIQAVWYDNETDLWIFQKFVKKGDDNPPQYYQAPYVNTYYNHKHHIQNRNDINRECYKASGLVIY